VLSGTCHPIIKDKDSEELSFKVQPVSKGQYKQRKPSNAAILACDIKRDEKQSTWLRTVIADHKTILQFFHINVNSSAKQVV
jgi:hypothetical protein